MKKIISIALVLAMALCLFAGCQGTDTTTGPKPTGTQPQGNVDYNTVLAGDYGEITLWVSDTVLEDGNSVVAVTEQQIAEFQKLYPNIKFTFQVDGVGEGSAASQVLTDVASAPDIYCFAQDQLARLVQAKALVPVAETIVAGIKDSNAISSVNAASVAGTLYAYPLTADNGIYMYYNKSVFTEEDVKDLATLVSVAEAKGGKIRWNLEDAWINAGFFFGAGCVSSWTMDTEGEWTGKEDTYNSDLGVIAMKGMQILAKSSAYDSDANKFTDAVAIVTGTWNSKAAADHFGENLAATKLPTYTVDGNSYQIGSYFGCKLMGIKPQSGDNAAKKTVVLQLLAQFLSNKDNQLARFNTFGWGPSNLEAQATDAVKNDPSLNAFNLQSQFATPQGNIHGSWWDIAKLLGSDAKNANSDDELRTALKTYEDAINALLEMTEEQKNAWGVIGGICGTNWDTDFPMTEQADGTFMSAALELKAGESLKVRQGGSWDVNYGASEGQAATSDGNLLVEADGTYYVKLTLSDNGGYVELVPAN